MVFEQTVGNVDAGANDAVGQGGKKTPFVDARTEIEMFFQNASAERSRDVEKIAFARARAQKRIFGKSGERKRRGKKMFRGSGGDVSSGKLHTTFRARLGNTAQEAVEPRGGNVAAHDEREHGIGGNAAHRRDIAHVAANQFFPGIFRRNAFVKMFGKNYAVGGDEAFRRSHGLGGETFRNGGKDGAIVADSARCGRRNFVKRVANAFDNFYFAECGNARRSVFRKRKILFFHREILILSCDFFNHKGVKKVFSIRVYLCSVAFSFSK